MKHIIVAIIAILFGIGIAVAQGRHDEKPHGSTKPSTSATEDKYEPMRACIIDCNQGAAPRTQEGSLNPFVTVFFKG